MSDISHIIIRLRRKADILRSDARRKHDLMLEHHANEMLALIDLLEYRVKEVDDGKV